MDSDAKEGGGYNVDEQGNQAEILRRKKSEAPANKWAAKAEADIGQSPQQT